jgi:hypothetical protein
MKDCPPRASLVTPPDCATELNAVSVKRKAIAYSSMEIRLRCTKTGHSDGEASVPFSGRISLFADLLRRPFYRMKDAGMIRLGALTKLRDSDAESQRQIPCNRVDTLRSSEHWRALALLDHRD